MLRIVHISGNEPIEPKKLTAKQRRDQEIRIMIDEQRKKDKKSAFRMLDEIKELLK